MPEHFIRVRVIEAKDLIAADSNGKFSFVLFYYSFNHNFFYFFIIIGFSDPYAILLVGKEKRKTSVVKVSLYFRMVLF